MIRLYSPDLNVFVDPTDHNVILWYQQHRVDPTIATLQTCLLYEETRTIKGGKYWDDKAQEIKYAKKRQKKVSGRYQLFEIPWSGLHDKFNRPIFHGDLIKDESADCQTLVCQVGVGVIKLLRPDTGLPSTSDISVNNLRRIGSAVLDPHLVGDEIRQLFVYQKPTES